MFVRVAYLTTDIKYVGCVIYCSRWRVRNCTGNTEWSKSHAVHFWRTSFLLKYIPLKSEKKPCSVKCWKCPPRSVLQAFTPCLVYDATRWTFPVSRKRFTRQDTVGLFGTGQQVNVPLNSLLQAKQERDARQRSAVESRCTVKKTSFCLHRLKTADGLAPAGYSMTWPVWAVVQSQWHCVCIDTVELHCTATINKYFNVGCATFWSTSVCLCLFIRLQHRIGRLW
jgi:hypothetical protein